MLLWSNSCHPCNSWLTCVIPWSLLFWPALCLLYHWSFCVSCTAVTELLSSALLWPITYTYPLTEWSLGHSSMASFLSVLCCPMWVGQAEACPFFDIACPSLSWPALLSLDPNVPCRIVFAMPELLVAWPYHFPCLYTCQQIHVRSNSLYYSHFVIYYVFFVWDSEEPSVASHFHCT